MSKVPLSNALHDWILQLQGVSHSPHRFGGTEYRVNGMEFMHSHGPTYLDIRLSMEDQKKILESGNAEQHRFAPEAGWITLRIRSEKDVETAKEVVMLAYKNAEEKIKIHELRRGRETEPVKQERPTG